MIKIDSEFNKNFSGLFFINLEKRKVKRQLMERQLRRLNVPFTRINGVDCVNFKEYRIKNYIKHGSLNHKGLIGCFLAHKKCLEHIHINYRENNKKFIVTEDDIKIYENLFQEITKIKIPDDCDILFLNSACRPGKPVPDAKYLVDENLYKIYETYPIFLGAFFYILNYDIIEKILNKIKQVNTYEDFDLFLFKNFNCYTYITKSLSLINFKSDRDPEAWHNKNKFEG